MSDDAEIHVLVIDDSAVVRQAFKQLIESEPGLSVSVAADPRIAERKLAERRPDVVILDLELPWMDGITWLRRQMLRDPLRVIVCSARLGSAAMSSIRALEEGALEVIPKPEIGVREFLLESRRNLIQSIRAAHMATLRAPHGQELASESPVRTRRPDTNPFAPAPEGAPSWRARRDPPEPETRRPPPIRAIGVAASTGGPQALQALLCAMPVDCPPIVVVQHMSAAFTGAFAQRLNELATIEVHEATHAECLAAGTALIAPGGRHLEVQADPASGALHTRLHEGPMRNGHRPSADLLFRSLARACRRDAVGVLLTGMGCDGAEGLLELRRAGALTCAESAKSCVVFGMPRAAIELGAAVEVAALEELTRGLVGRIRQAAEAAPPDAPEAG